MAAEATATMAHTATAQGPASFICNKQTILSRTVGPSQQKMDLFHTILQLIIISSLHDMRGMNAYRAGHIRLSVRIIQLENRWTDLDEI
jgi:hypothetical protein